MYGLFSKLDALRFPYRLFRDLNHTISILLLKNLFNIISLPFFKLDQFKRKLIYLLFIHIVNLNTIIQSRYLFIYKILQKYVT